MCPRGHDVRFCNNLHNPDPLPDPLSSTSTSTKCCLEFATCQWLSNVPGQQWVRIASPQLAPTAPATAVFIALSSMCQLMLLLSACPSAQWLGLGARTLPPFSTVPGQLSPVGAVGVGCKHSARLTPLCVVDRHVGPFLYRVRGAHAGQGSSVGRHLLPLAMPIPGSCLVLGPKGPVGTGDTQN